MKKFTAFFSRVLLVAVCCTATWLSIRHARADFAAGPLTAEGLARAVQIEPENVELVPWNALLMSYNADPSPTVDEQLMRASGMDPFNSEILMAFRAARGIPSYNTGAERYLERATEVDHTFKPAWTYANFCVRNDELDKFWPLAKRCLNLDRLGYDPRPVFDLAWHLTDDAKKIRDILPRTGPRLVDYLRVSRWTQTGQTPPANCGPMRWQLPIRRTRAVWIRLRGIATSWLMQGECRWR